MTNEQIKSQTLTIHSLNLNLPQMFAARAESIAKQLGQALRTISLEELGISGTHHIHCLDIPKLIMDEAASDKLVARKIAELVRQQIQREFALSTPQTSKMSASSIDAARHQKAGNVSAIGREQSCR